jgi:hypothetical protein
MNTRENKIWEGEGLLWQNLSIYETAEGMVGVLSNPTPSYMGEMVIKFADRVGPLQEIVAEIKDTDQQYYDIQGEGGEEG